MTYESVMKIFADYIASDNMIDVVNSKWGYMFIYIDTELLRSSGKILFTELVLCETPEKLYNKLKETFIEYEATKICEEKKKNKLIEEFDEDKELELATQSAEDKFYIYLKGHSIH